MKEILPGIYRFTSYVAPGIPGASLYVRTAHGPIVVDPLIPKGGFDAMAELGDPNAVVLTSHWHERDAGAYEARFGLRRWVNALPDDRESRHGVRYRAGDVLFDEIETVDLGGVGPGETALLMKRDGGILIVGDAFFNFARDGMLGGWFLPVFLPYGPPQPRPAWLCSEPERSRRELDTLRALRFEHLLPSHGEPMLGGASERVVAALDAQDRAHRRRAES